MTKPLFFFSLALLGLACQPSPTPNITTGSLLLEMIDREQLTRFPDPAYTCKQFSSYDRNSVAPDQPGWFANRDRSQFVRMEQNQGRREFVLMDADGPGAVVRFWVTVAEYSGNGTLRIYLDRAEEPTLEGEVLSLISGDSLVGPPLATSVAPTAEYLKRGHNLYFPIAYQQHCKITYESDSLTEEPGAKSGEAFYYHINYRSYPAGTQVKTFSQADLNTYADVLTMVQDRLSGEPYERLPFTKEVDYVYTPLKPGESRSVILKGVKAVRRLRVKLKAANYAQALRSTILQLTFDDQPTVWCPVGDYFGTGYQHSPHRTWFTEVTDDSMMNGFWIMPFTQQCEATLLNLGDTSVEIRAFHLESRPYDWSSRSMYFGAGWRELHAVSTGGGERSMEGQDGDFFDINYVTLSGEGMLVGTGLTLFNTVDAWWGEGDEKIFVDGEKFPSHIGTGTEDYFGYAWALPNVFSHPFVAQPDGRGAQHPGHVVNLRFRGLDAIPFTRSLQFDLEMWHWVETTLNYAPVSYWYMRPGGTANLKPMPEQASKTVRVNAAISMHR